MINVAYNSDTYEGRILSNLALTPFNLYGERWDSVEAFWKSLYLPIPEREEHAKKHGLEAWRIFDGPYPKKIEMPCDLLCEYTTNPGIAHLLSSRKICDEGSSVVSLVTGSTLHQGLMKEALIAKSTNPAVMEVFESTKNEIYTHRLRRNDGSPLPDSKTIPALVFCRMLEDVRDMVVGHGSVNN